MKLRQTTKVVHKSINGDIFKARQDLRDETVWYLEHYRHGEQKASMRLKVTAHNCNALFKLLKLEKPTNSPYWQVRGRDKNGHISTQMPIYRKIKQGEGYGDR